MNFQNNPQELFTPFLSTTYNVPEEEERWKTYLVDRLSVFSDIINDKKIGVITQASENFNGDKFFYGSTEITRNGFQALAFIPSLPNATTITLTLTSNPSYPVPAVNTEFVITQLYGTASLPPSSTGAGDGDFFQFNNQGDTRISFTMSDNQLVITSTVDLTAYTGLIIVHYLRNGL